MAYNDVYCAQVWEMCFHLNLMALNILHIEPKREAKTGIATGK